MQKLSSFLSEKLGNLLDLFGALIDFGKNFKGFLGFSAFVITAGVLVLFTLFSDGSFDHIIENFSTLNSDQFFILLLVLIIGGLLLLFMVIILGYLDYRQRGDSLPATAPASGSSGSDAAAAGFYTGSTLPPPPGPAEPEPIDMTTLIPQERVFISYADQHHVQACQIAELLRDHNYYVWEIEKADPIAHLDIGTEQALRRSDMVIVLVSNAFGEALGVRVQAEFAHDLGKPVVFVLVEPPRPPLDSRFPEGRRLTIYGNWEAEGRAILDRLRRISASGLRDQDSPQPPPAQSRLAPGVHVKEDAKQGVNGPAFVYGVSVRPEMFVGRHAVLSTIRNRLAVDLQSVSIVSDRRMGKTSLLNYIANRPDQVLPNGGQHVAVYINMQDARAKDPAGVMRLLRRNIQQRLEVPLWAEAQDGDLLVLAETFEELAALDVRLLLCLDEWETVMAYPELDDLLDQFRASGVLSQIGMVVATAHDLAELSRVGKLTSPFYNIFDTVYMGLMPRVEWTTLVGRAFLRGGRQVEDRELDQIEALAGGHPSLTQMAGSVLWQAREHDWQLAEINAQYRRLASSILTSTWARLSQDERAAVREALGIHSEERAAQDVWDGLQRRGVLKANGDVFCKPFADLVLAEAL